MAFTAKLARLIFLVAFALPLICHAETFHTQTNVPVEITFHSTRPHRDPFNELSMDVVVTDPLEKRFVVPAFWDGGNTWKVRYASPRLGTHLFKTVCSDPLDKGLDAVQGTIRVEPYRGKNPLLVHGPIRIAPDKHHLCYADGKPFFWLGDTWWMGLASRLQWPNEFKTLTADRVKKGFTVVQIVAGLYPDSMPFDARGVNEAGHPWEDDFGRINPAYFDRADERIRYLVDQGISPCIVGAWGYFMEFMGPEKVQKHWRYLIARYGAYPVVWCAAGEVNLPWYLSKSFPNFPVEQVHQWTDVMHFIHDWDPYHRLLTTHPTAVNFYTSRRAIDDAKLLDFDMLQTPHGEVSAAQIAATEVRKSYLAPLKMPVIDGEAAYEMLSDSLPTRWTRAMFWVCMLNGAAGHTYGANGIWQNNRPNDPHGKSPHGANYGKISSQEAMNLPGSSQMGFGKKLFERFNWTKFEPHPEWAASTLSNHPNFFGSHWIWFPEGQPNVDAPVAARYFRQEVQLPNKRVKEARLAVNADDSVTAFVNGVTLDSVTDWRTGLLTYGFESLFVPGRNILSVRAENIASKVDKNPAGMIATLALTFEDGTSQVWRTDKTWRASKTSPNGWKTTALDDHSWPMAMEVANYGDGPWGRAGEWDSMIGPQAAGIVGGVRIIYMVQPSAVIAKCLVPGKSYSIQYFDPVTGKTSPPKNSQANKEGELQCLPPQGCDHDWVLILNG